MKSMLVSALVGAGMLVAVQALGDVPAVVACATKHDPAERLQCYDSTVAKLKEELTQAQEKKREFFGFSLPFGGTTEGGETDTETPRFGPREETQVTGKVTKTTKDSSGHVLVTLENGQTWRIEDYSHPILMPGRDSALIVRNIFGGFYLGLNGRQNNLSVTRIK